MDVTSALLYACSSSEGVDMSDHTTALAPLGVGHFNSPGLIDLGLPIDMGLLSEALVYYDQVLLFAENQQQFGHLVGWFMKRNLFSKFLDMLHDGDLQVYYNAFRTNVYVKGDHIEPINIVEKLEHKPDCFIERFLGNEAVKKEFPRRSLRYDLRDALNGKVVKAKVDEFGADGLQNAKRDFLDPRRCTLLLQAVVDEIYRVNSLGRPPEVKATIRPLENESGVVGIT